MKIASACPVFKKEVAEGCNYELDGLSFTSIGDFLAHVNKTNPSKISHSQMKQICSKCKSSRL